ncbi:alpha/beta fold hydrolase [Candidatus Woesearchaeota archaeon]|jgi:pimeloyl-ACP methyl ester carboxylesterase|nr:alpha/beta fold hydrolase [Candidatus Woesearchaeota archaeon]MBT6519301.1 alpha/beta fold hydrolase [Candidatus Woesearchaeota archaeon]MBT7368954.1 alpha/beta fold hydrolase [Candidatus Woesearchaeota archaeon]
MNILIQNKLNEKLDAVIEGNKESNQINIFVHGFGTNKDEGFNIFKDLSDCLKQDFLNIRFDLSGYGKSEGKDYEFNLDKAADDIESVINYVKKQYSTKKINIIAHSLGTFAVMSLSPANITNITKIIFTGIPNSKTDFVVKGIQKRISSKGGEINESGITTYPRSSGTKDMIGPQFWTTLKNLNPLEALTHIGNKTNITIFKPMQDEVLEYKYFEEYKKISDKEENKNQINYIELNGDHNFSKPKNRKNLFEQIKKILLS